MASKAIASIALLLTFNLLFFTMVSSTYVPCPPEPKKSPSKAPPKSPKPSPSPSPAKKTCPKDTLKFGACADLLNSDLVHLIVGTPASTPCCTLLKGLADAEAALCLCTALKPNVLGLKVNAAVDLSVLLNYCGKKAPTGFQCA